MTPRTHIDQFDAYARSFVVRDIPTDTAADIEAQSAAAEKWHAMHGDPTPTSAVLDLLWQIAGHFVSYAELERDRLARMVDEARAAA